MEFLADILFNPKTSLERRTQIFFCVFSLSYTVEYQVYVIWITVDNSDCILGWLKFHGCL